MKNLSKIFVFFDSYDKENTPTPKKNQYPSIHPYHFLPPDLQYLKSLQKSIMFTPCKDPLSTHNITPLHRQQVIEWLTEVCLRYSTKQVFFLTVKLMDQFFQSFDQVLFPEDLHIVCVSCLFIASKLLDVVPVKLKTLLTKICMGKYSVSQFVNAEKIVLETLEFNVNLTTIYEFLVYFGWKFQLAVTFLYSCEILAFLMQMDYGILRFNCEEIALGCIVFVAGKSKMYEEAAKILAQSAKVPIDSILKEIQSFWNSLPLRSVNLSRLSMFFQVEILPATSSSLFKFSKSPTAP